MFKNLVCDLQKLWKENQSLKGIDQKPSYITYIESPTFLSSLDTFSNYQFGETDTSPMFGGVRVRVLDTLEGWTISLAEFDAPSSDIVAFPHPTFITPISDGSWCSYRSYSIAPEFLDQPILNSTHSINPIEKKNTLSKGKFWFPSKYETVLEVVKFAPKAIFLRVIGPTYGNYLHTFSKKEKTYLSTTYSDGKIVSRVFYADFIKAITESDVLDSMSEKEVCDIKDYIHKTADLNNKVPHEVWPLIQAMTKINSKDTLEILNKFAASDHFLSSRAQSVVQKYN